MGSKEGQLKQAAARTGVTVNEWKALRARGLRWCFDCKAWRSGSMFGVDKSRASGSASLCDPCKVIASLASTYKITKARVRELKSRGCEICGALTPKINIDHDHKTGKVRGALCPSCNVIIGLARDEPERLRKAIVYLEVHRG